MSETAPKRRKRSARFTDIALRAGVSVATVDRVLNERDTVSENARAKVLEAARTLDLPRHLPEQEHGLIHIDVLLPRSETPFFRTLAAAFRDAAALLDRRVIVHRRILVEGNVAAMATAIRQPERPRAAVIFAAPDVPAIRSAVAQALERGEAAAAVVTELPDLPGLAYCGMDNRRAGRVAGHLMGRMIQNPGRVVVLGNAALYRAHVERFEGFREAAASFPGLEVDMIETATRDEPDRCRYALRATNAGTIRGIYNTGAGSAGILAELLPLGVARPVWIGHEASPDHVEYLDRGILDIVIDQDPVGQAMAALQHVLRATGALKPNATPARSELRVHTRYSLR